MGDGGALKMEAIVGELFLKASHIILGARTTPAARTPQRKAAKSWFNLEVEEVQSAVRELEPWRRQITVPLVIEVYLQAWGHQQNGSGAANSAQLQAGETMLERWTLDFSLRSQQSGAPQPPPAVRLDTPAVYKRMVIALRSLYSYVRVLPAYRLSAACRRDGGANCSMRYRIALAPSPDVRSGASGRLQAYAFAPIDTPDGVFQMAVSHQPASAVRLLERTTAPHALPHIIADYVGDGAGGRGARLPDGEGALPRRSTLSASLCGGASWKGGAPTPAGGPSPPAQPTYAGAAPLLRRHSWSLQGRTASGQLPASPGALPPPTPPSPQYSPRYPQSGTPPTAARTRSTPPRYPSTLSSPRPGTPPHEAGAAMPLPVPSLRPRAGASRLSPVEPGVAARPLPVSPPRHIPSGGDRQAQPPPGVTSAQQQPPTPAGSGCSASRRTSAPVCIPQASSGSRRLLSSVDLAALDTHEGSRPHPAVAPSSAPAGGGLAAARSATAAAMAAAGGCRVTVPSAAQQGATPEQRAAPTPFAMPHPLAQPDEVASSGPATPATPSLPHQTAPYLHSEASSCSTTYQLAGSPQLPFAVTPSSSHSLASLAAAGDGHAQPWGPSPPMSGRHLSALSAVRRQPSWGARSSAGAAQEVRDSGPQAVGYSVSPVGDHLLSSVAAARSLAASSGSGGGAEPRPGLLLAPRVTFGDGPGRLAAPPHTSAAMEPYPLDPEESSDMLPFALDESPGGGAGGGLLAGAADTEEALGAFVRMLEQAPPLHAPPRGAAPPRFGSSSERLAGSGGGGSGGGHTSASQHLTLAAGLQQLAALQGALPQQQPAALAT